MRSPRTAAAAWPRARAVGCEHKRAWGRWLRLKSTHPRFSGYLSALRAAAPLRPCHPVAQVARKAKEARSLTPKDLPPAREAENRALPSSRTCLALSLLQLPLRAAPCCSASSQPTPSPTSRKRAGGVFARPKGRAVCPRSSERCVSFFAHLPRPLAPPATSPRRSPQLRSVPAVLLVQAIRGRRRSCVRSPNRSAACPRSSDCPIILHSPPFALSLDELTLRAARRSSASYPPTAHVLIEAWD